MTAVYSRYMRIMRTTKTQKLKFASSPPHVKMQAWLLRYTPLSLAFGIFFSSLKLLECAWALKGKFRDLKVRI